TLLTQPPPWPATTTPRRAAISSFGLSGTNAHVIIEQAPPAEEPARVADPVPQPAPSAVPWVLSAASPTALRAQATRLLTHLHDHPGTPPDDLAYSLALTRAHHHHRAALTGPDPRAALTALAHDTPHPHLHTAEAHPHPRITFLFPGQGTQWPAMARHLLTTHPVFTTHITRCADALAPFTDWNLLDVLRGEPGAPGLDRVDVVQPVLWAVMVSLAEVWRHHGIHPDAVIGHSQGEIAAATTAGILTLHDAAKVTALRSRALTALTGHGAMLSLTHPTARVRELIARWDGRIALAAVNGPASTVVSGDREAIEELLTACEREDVRARRIDVDYASHSAHVEAIETDLLRLLDDISPRPGTVPLYSSLTGTLLDGTAMNAAYWYRNLRETVRFEQATRAALDDGHTLFVETSPHPVLTLGLHDTISDTHTDAAILPTLRRDHGTLAQLHTALAHAHAHGAPLDWRTLFTDAAPRRVPLPTYPFQRTRYWPELPEPAAAPVDEVDARFWDAVAQEDLGALSQALDGADAEPLKAALPTLSAWRRRRTERSALDAWRYRVVWRPTASVGTGPALLTGRWLLAVPGEPGGDGKPADAVADALTAHGAEVVRVAVTERAALAAELARIGPGSVAGVVALPAPAASDGDVAAVAGTVALLQALGDAGVPAPLWSLTRGAVCVSGADRPVDPAQAAVWGLGRVAGLELPQRWGGLVDLPAELDESAAERLCAVLVADRGEDQLALRPQGVFARRLVRAGADGTAPGWAPRGTVLVTGGTGALGGHVARWLARAGAEHLVLTGRRGPDAPGAAALRDELTALGARVTLAACDVTDGTALAALLERLDAAGDAPTAVVHAAGTTDDGLIDALTPERVVEGTRAKVAGAAHLHRLTEERDLDAFVLFSAVSGTVGGVGQATYAAANAYLDGLAAHRRALGLAGTALAFGPWADGGTARADDGFADRSRGRGLPVLPTEAALSALATAGRSDAGGTGADPGDGAGPGAPEAAAVLVADVDWPVLLSALLAARPAAWLGELPEVRAFLAESAGARGADGGAEAFTARLATLSPAEASRALLELVRTEAASVLGYDSDEPIGAKRPFRDLGFESLTAVNLRNQLSARTGLTLPVTLVFDHPTPTALAEFLRDRLGEGRQSPETAVLSELGRLEEGLSALDDEGARQRVTARLRALVARLDGQPGADEADGVAERLDAADADAVLAFIDSEFGEA
ncbi:SDR family NAD(P)-dependent oxidoreductase, partial [Streptomyces sp. JWR5-1]|uniref:SDR family NAD(P)-dependent oxidoreductase n=1 Tax=Streptomyces sp. JWR5-1 TaxID=3122053 RepID=UPI00301A9C72